MMKIEDLTQWNDFEVSENIAEEFARLNAQSSIPNPKYHIFIVLNK